MGIVDCCGGISPRSFDLVRVRFLVPPVAKCALFALLRGEKDQTPVKQRARTSPSGGALHLCSFVKEYQRRPPEAPRRRFGSGGRAMMRLTFLSPPSILLNESHRFLAVSISRVVRWGSIFFFRQSLGQLSPLAWCVVFATS